MGFGYQRLGLDEGQHPQPGIQLPEPEGQRMGSDSNLRRVGNESKYCFRNKCLQHFSITNYVIVSQKNVTGLDCSPIVPEFIDYLGISVNG